MRQCGSIVRRDTTRGFGFIRSSTQVDAFFHVRDFRGAPGTIALHCGALVPWLWRGPQTLLF